MLIGFDLSISFMVNDFGVLFKNFFPLARSQEGTFLFSSGNFVLFFTFRQSIHPELIFVYGVSQGSGFFF